jgi:hypothetical protein
MNQFKNSKKWQQKSSPDKEWAAYFLNFFLANFGRK